MRRIPVAPMIVIPLLILFTSASLDYHRFVETDLISSALTLETQDKKGDVRPGGPKIVTSAISPVLSFLEDSLFPQPPSFSFSVPFRDAKACILRC